ncbi:MAG: hypothetical protein WBG50_18740 [Desulfomonilaceae bacterium]
MRRPLWKTVSIMALFLAVPASCLAGPVGPVPVSQEFDKKTGLADSHVNSHGGTCQNSPATAAKMIAPTRKSPMPTPLYPPNVVRNQGASHGGTTSLSDIFAFLIPAKKDLDKCFKAEDKAFRDRGRSGRKPFRSEVGKE